MILVAPFSHEEQVWKRLKFLAKFAKTTGVLISESQLSQIFEQSAGSGLPSDMQAFFLWSSEAVRSEAIDKAVKDKFFSENLLHENAMKLDNLPLSGYEFLRDMFID